MNKVMLALLIPAAFTFGCVTPVKTVNHYDVSSAALKNIREMKHLPDSALSDSGYTDIGVVSGSSCHSYARVYAGTGSETSKRKVFEQLILSAADMGAEHITTPHCEVLESVEPGDDCTANLMCVSHALKVLPTTAVEQI
jgi:hypothetical protein